jgi:hypothetical protein
MQINKSDRNDAVGIARIMQCGWYKEVRVKDLDSHAIKALLVSRALLVKIKRDKENQIRGLLKNLGLVIGRAKLNFFAMRAAELAEARPELGAAVEPLLKAREAVGRQIADLDRKVLRLARNNAQVRRFMTAPGVGPFTLLSFCTECGSMAPNSNGRQRRLPINLHSRTIEFPPIRSAGTNVPAGTLTLVRSLLVLRGSSEQNALHTLIHQRHLTPSCGRHAPTAERTLNPARMFKRELDPGPGIRE